MSTRPTIRQWAILAMLFTWTVVQLLAMPRLGIGYDEAGFALYGTRILKGEGEKDIVKFDSKLPITAFNMLPRAAQQVIRPGLHKDDWKEDILKGRYVTLAATLLLALLILRWADELTGNGLPAMALFLLCPNFLAHGVMVSSDMFACLFMTAALYGTWVTWRGGRPWSIVFTATATGLALLSKFSMVHLALLVFVFMLFLALRNLRSGAWGLKKVILTLATVVIIPWFLLCAGHLFHDCFFRLGDHHYLSPSFQALAERAPSLRIPLPSAYVRSMDAVMHFDRLGGGVPGALNGAPYLLGEQNVHGFAYYYPVVMLFKMPLATWAILLWSAVLGIRGLVRKTVTPDRIILLLPVAWYLVYMDLFYSTQVGIRHILIIFPLLFILAATLWQGADRTKRIVLGVLLAWQLVDVAAWFPHFLPYTNQLVPDKRMAYTRLADTNLCYGEGTGFLNDYLATHPGVIVSPDGPVVGRVAVEVNDLLNLSMGSLHRYDWLKDSLPVDHVHSQYLIFEVKQVP